MVMLKAHWFVPSSFSFLNPRSPSLSPAGRGEGEGGLILMSFSICSQNFILISLGSSLSLLITVSGTTILVAKLFFCLFHRFENPDFSFLYVFHRLSNLLLPFLTPEPCLLPGYFHYRTNYNFFPTSSNLHPFPNL